MSTKHTRPPIPSPLAALSAIDTSYYARSPASSGTSRFSAHYPPPLPPTEVVPRLFLADISAAENIATLSSLGITHVVSAMSGFVSLPVRIPSSHHLQLPLQDNPFAELAAHLPQATAFISQALSNPHARVLVHCVQGISRSSSVVAGYLVATGMSPADAVSFVKSKRSHADPNPGFVSQLGEYAESLRGNGGA
ncbi:protein-tyrosine phosphatase-like protein [Cristinia sonorae]|uniref:Protein-tyrosine phosphatase-like protein n=1 Tax=Cristinia sonorae TaxID=1940300 RepID=A0A8K0XUD3_9AGAR|nr:protein-tyrosine phosphatase-like protein [Cristinia sonorae]